MHKPLAAGQYRTENVSLAGSEFVAHRFAMHAWAT